MLAALKNWLSPSPIRVRAHECYVHITQQSRRSVFYADWQVPDTLDGRFDIIVLHLCLVLERLGDTRADEELGEFSRYLQECFFADMDRSLREMGVSDTGVGKRVKKMAEAFYGRQQSYGNEAVLAEALKRNVYRDESVDAATLAALEAYVVRNRNHLRTIEPALIASGQTPLFID